MAGDASPYATLGLKPGADAAAIAKAYKRLIKRHHPDRAGGDVKRASEINRAYRELRLAGEAKEPLDLEFSEELRRGQSRSTQAALLLCALLLVLGLVTGLAQRNAPLVQPVGAARSPPSAQPLNMMERPISTEAINAGIGDAVRLWGSEDEIALAGQSRECHRRLRADPNLGQLDRCAAFDDAVILLQDRDPLRNTGPFSELAVTGRLMSGGTLLSDDYLAVDGRLDRVRLQVELALARKELPRLPDAGPAA